MAKFVKPLTETRIKLLKPKQTPYSDGNNLYLHVYNANKKTFLLWYTDPISKKRLKRKIGEHPDLSLEEARETTRRYNKLISKGLDPFQYLADQAKEEEKQKITLYEFAQIWKDTKITRKENKATTMKKEYSRLELHLFPIFGDTSLHSINDNAQEIQRAFLPLYKAKPNTAEKVIGRLIDIMNLAEELFYIDENKLTRLKRTFKRIKGKPNPTIKAECLPDLFKMLYYCNSLTTTKLLIEWQILTMLRPIESVRIEWQDIDWKNKTLYIAGEKMKGTAKAPKAHIVPLSSQAIFLLEEIKKHNGNNKFVFSHHSDRTKHASSQTANSVLKRNGYKDVLTSHGLRAMARTYLADKGIDYQVAEVCLAHAVGSGISRIYNRSDYLELRRGVMQMWGDYVAQCKRF
ncbi:tyrosine-type recombinase/integrase [Gallibacterium anatis]|uniref:tyrosine-type recombinase/integrase n=3 Tax=Gallibacterium anatis TaxID=750 RepID=UPI0030C9C1F2